MATAKKRHRPAMTPEARENQLIAEAMDLAEERIASGKASSQEIIHFLRLGSSKVRLENEKLRNENQLLKAKTEALESQKRTEQLYADAITAMGIYSGQINSVDETE